MNNAFERECAAAHVCNDDKNIAEKLLSDSRPVKYASTPIDLNAGNDLLRPELLDEIRRANAIKPDLDTARKPNLEPGMKDNPLPKKLTLSQAGNDVANPELLEQMRAMNLIRPKPEGAKRPEDVVPAPKVNPLTKKLNLSQADNDIAHPELIDKQRAYNLTRPGFEGSKGPAGGRPYLEPAPKVNPLSKRVDLKELTTLTAQLLSDRRSA
jgi:hypothetical protein